MALQLGALREALVEAGASPARAAKAAEEVAAYETRLGGFDVKLEEMKGTLRTMQWMMATLIAGVAALLIKAYG
jgi:hypothetical protein